MTMSDDLSSEGEAEMVMSPAVECRWRHGVSMSKGNCPQSSLRSSQKDTRLLEV